MYLSVKSTSKNSAIAMSVILQSTNQIVAKPAMNALPPLNLYHTGKQWPSIAQSPENCAPNCHWSKYAHITHAVMDTTNIVLTTSKISTSHVTSPLP